MKKLLPASIFLIIIISAFLYATNFIVTPNTQNLTDKNADMKNALEMYEEFLRGERDISSTYCIDYGNRIETKTHEISIKNVDSYATESYALFDMNGDGIPELHLRTNGPYTIITYRNNELVVWSSWWRYAMPLNNGTILNAVEGSGPPHISYAYIVNDFYGNEVLRISFDKGDIDYDGDYDENDDYIFENVKVSKDYWDKLTEKYLSIGSDKIEWFSYSDGVIVPN